MKTKSMLAGPDEIPGLNEETKPQGATTSSIRRTARYGRLILLLAMLFCSLAAQAVPWCEVGSPFKWYLSCLSTATGPHTGSGGCSTCGTIFCRDEYLRMCAVCGVEPRMPVFAEIDLGAVAVVNIPAGATSYLAQVGFVSRTNWESIVHSPTEVISVSFYVASFTAVNAASNMQEVSWSFAGNGSINAESNLWQLAVNTENQLGSNVLRADITTAQGTFTNAAFLLLARSAPGCCDNCAPPFPATLAVTVQPGFNFLANPFCHGAANALGSILATPPDGATLFKFNKATQNYNDPFTYDSGFGGWVDSNFDPASSTPLPPGEGFLFNNPGAAFTLTFTGCEPDCGPRCPPTNGLCLVGRTGSATNAVIWEHLFNCPPVCGSQVSVFSTATQSFQTYTFLSTGWSPATPTWAAGTSVFVGLTNCNPCAPLPACAVAYWKAENNAQDSFSNLHATAFNGTAYLPGVSGQAWSFDGVSDYVHVPYRSAMSVVNGLTLAAWVSPAANPPTTAVIAGRPLGYQLDMLPNGKARFAITIGPSVFASVDSPQPLPLNQFTFVAGTYDPTTGELKIYTNCILAATSTVAAGSRALYHRPNSPFQIGGFNDPSIPFTGGFLNGRVDDVTLFGCALSQQELNARCTAGSAGWCCPEPPPCTNALLLVCPQDVNVPNDPGLCSAVVQYVPPTATGGCSSNVTVTCTPPSGLFPVGTTTVTCLATNGAGQSATCTFRVTVRDADAPTILACPTNRVIRSCAAIAPDLRGEVQFTDCDPFSVTVNQTPAPGTPLTPGTHNFVFDIRDSAGNGVGCLAQITVVAPADPATLGLFNTGVDNARVRLPFGATDAHYAAVSSPAGVVGPIAVNSHPAWVPDASSTASRWIHIGTSASSVAGTYVYRLTLDLSSVPVSERACLVLRGRWAADNGVELWVNGLLKASRPVSFAYRTWAPLVLNGLPNTGTVQLEFRVQDDGGYGGLRVEWQEITCGGCNGGVNPAIATQPTGQILNPAASGAVALSYAVIASGAGPLAYQWYRNGVPLVNGTNISGADTPVLSHTVQQTPWRLLVNEYYCEVSNSFGMTASHVAVASNFQISNPTFSGGQMQFTFPTRTNGTYVVESAATLSTAAVWQAVQTLQGTGGAATVTQPASGSSGFYRLREEPDEWEE
jgi:Concanavalin A-like lectin/glucanases superfamily/HYR domain